MSEQSYTRAIAAFEALLLSPQDTRIDMPATLIREADLPTSTGYRYLTILEGSGLLSRNKEGAYTLGPAALRVGLTALGVGHLAVLAPPILLRLRETTGRTAFLAIQIDEIITICSFSLGRETRPMELARHYRLPQASTLAAADVSDVFLTDTSTASARLLRALLCPVPRTKGAFLGLCAGAQTEVDAQLGEALARSAAFFEPEQ